MVHTFVYVCQDGNGRVNIYNSKPEFHDVSSTKSAWYYGDDNDTDEKLAHIYIGMAKVHPDHETLLIHMLPDLPYAKVIKETFKDFTAVIDLL